MCLILKPRRVSTRSREAPIIEDSAAVLVVIVRVVSDETIIINESWTVFSAGVLHVFPDPRNSNNNVLCVATKPTSVVRSCKQPGRAALRNKARTAEGCRFPLLECFAFGTTPT